MCSCCTTETRDLTVRDSQTLDGWRFYLCPKCMGNTCEPRWAIVIAIRKHKSDLAKELIQKNLYCGDPITAQEVL